MWMHTHWVVDDLDAITWNGLPPKVALLPVAATVRRVGISNGPLPNRVRSAWAVDSGLEGFEVAAGPLPRPDSAGTPVGQMLVGANR